MPIRKEMKHLYPPPKEWKAIRANVLDRAQNVCECDGRCGHEHQLGVCFVPNRTNVLWREVDGRSTWILHWGSNPDGVVQVVLTIAHLDHDPTNNDPSNLRAMCQRCHLRYDSKEHQKNAAETRRKNAEKLTGQKRLF